MLAKQNGVTTGLLDLYGTVGLLRPNHLHGPTANPAIRRTMLAAIDQVETMTAAMGDDKSTWAAPMGFIVPGMPSATQAGMENVRVRKTTDQLKRMLEQAGYKGEKLVFMHPTDQVIYHAMSLVAVDAFQKIGMNVDEQLTDWGTIVQRRPSKEPLDKGGWSMFPAGAPAPEFIDPMLSNPMRSNGAKAWFGWPDDPQLEGAYESWLDADNDPQRRALEAEYQLAAFNSVPIIPCGQYKPKSAWRSTVSGLVKGSAPVFWGATKA